MPESEKLQ